MRGSSLTLRERPARSAAWPNLRRARIRPCSVLLIALGCARAFAAAPAPLLPGPFVQVIDVMPREDHADITIQFSCGARYVTNSPINHGSSTRITLRLDPQCGSLLRVFPPELPVVGGGGNLVTGARVESVVPGEVMIQLDWSRELDFVMAPTASGQGLRVRLIGTGRRRGSVTIAEPDAVAAFAVNLESSQESFPHDAVEAAASVAQAQAYVSETDIEDTHWYRMRIGPFSTRAEAERVLQAVLPRYPRAWLAVNDEDPGLTVVERAGNVPPPPPLAETDAPLPDAERAELLRQARRALEEQRYPEAVDLLTRLLRQPEYPGRADAQELAGLVRERAGQLAQAKAEYQTYLSRYADRPGATRVRNRLQALAAASMSAKSRSDGQAAAESNWSLVGSGALTYQYGRDQIVSPGAATTTTSVDAALIYGDLLIRDRGQRYDITARVDAGYTQNFVSTFGGSQDRTTAAYVEVTDRSLGLTGRFGRQSLATLGAIGIFDGLFVGYQASSRWSLTAAAGLPAYSSYSPLSTQSKFGTVAAEYSLSHWVYDAYLFDQWVGSETDRRSVGFQTRYAVPGRTAVMLLDYDIAFKQLNSVTLIGNAGIGRSWILGFDVDHRRSPLLELDNALIGQSAPTLDELARQFTPSQIRQLALDRTATSDTAVISASRPLGERWQIMVDVAALRLGGTPASGGVAATESTGLDKNVAAQLSGASLWQAGDLHIFGIRFDDSPQSRSTTLSWDARFALAGAWRFGPRFSVERLDDQLLGGRQWLFLPQVRGDWTSTRSVFELIAGYQIQQQTLQQTPGAGAALQTNSVSERSLYVSAAYRIRF